MLKDSMIRPSDTGKCGNLFTHNSRLGRISQSALRRDDEIHMLQYIWRMQLDIQREKNCKVVKREETHWISISSLMRQRSPQLYTDFHAIPSHLTWRWNISTPSIQKIIWKRFLVSCSHLVPSGVMGCLILDEAWLLRCCVACASSTCARQTMCSAANEKGYRWPQKGHRTKIIMEWLQPRYSVLTLCHWRRNLGYDGIHANLKFPIEPQFIYTATCLPLRTFPIATFGL